MSEGGESLLGRIKGKLFGGRGRTGEKIDTPPGFDPNRTVGWDPKTGKIYGKYEVPVREGYSSPSRPTEQPQSREPYISPEKEQVKVIPKPDIPAPSSTKLPTETSE
jgi:hypothetical protein